MSSRLGFIIIIDSDFYRAKRYRSIQLDSISVNVRYRSLRGLRGRVVRAAGLKSEEPG